MKQTHHEGKIRDNLIWDETLEEWRWNGASKERTKTSEKRTVVVALFTYFILPIIIFQALTSIGISDINAFLIGVAIGAIITYEIVKDPTGMGEDE